jgi:hypothetical protein
MALLITQSPNSLLSTRLRPNISCHVCERNGLSGYDILVDGQKNPAPLLAREYSIEINIFLDNLKTFDKIECPFCRLILSRLPQNRLVELQLGRTTSNLVLREFSRPSPTGTKAQEKRLSILSNDRSCGSLRKVVKPSLYAVITYLI